MQLTCDHPWAVSRKNNSRFLWTFSVLSLILLPRIWPSWGLPLSSMPGTKLREKSVLDTYLPKQWVPRLSLGGSFVCSWYLQHCQTEGRGCFSMIMWERKWKDGKAEHKRLVQLSSPICLHSLPYGDEDSIAQTVCVPGNSHFCAISKLPHGKHTNFAHTSAVCLISGFHSELEDKI